MEHRCAGAGHAEWFDLDFAGRGQSVENFRRVIAAESLQLRDFSGGLKSRFHPVAHAGNVFIPGGGMSWREDDLHAIGSMDVKG